MLVDRGVLRDRRLLKQICDETSIGEGDVLSALSRGSRVTARALATGQRVLWPRLGYFRLTLLYVPVARSEFNPRRHIKGVRIRFHPDPELVEEVRRAAFHRAQAPRKRRPRGRNGVR